MTRSCQRARRARPPVRRPPTTRSSESSRTHSSRTRSSGSSAAARSSRSPRSASPSSKASSDARSRRLPACAATALSSADAPERRHRGIDRPCAGRTQLRPPRAAAATASSGPTIDAARCHTLRLRRSAPGPRPSAACAACRLLIEADSVNGGADERVAKANGPSVEHDQPGRHRRAEVVNARRRGPTWLLRCKDLGDAVRVVEGRQQHQIAHYREAALPPELRTPAPDDRSSAARHPGDPPASHRAPWATRSAPAGSRQAASSTIARLAVAQPRRVGIAGLLPTRGASSSAKRSSGSPPSARSGRDSRRDPRRAATPDRTPPAGRRTPTPQRSSDPAIACRPRAQHRRRAAASASRSSAARATRN